MNSMRLILYTLLFSAPVWAEGYRLEPNQLIISESDWPGWNFPAGSVDFSDEGVRPHFVRRQTNAALNAGGLQPRGRDRRHPTGGDQFRWRGAAHGRAGGDLLGAGTGRAVARLVGRGGSGSGGVGPRKWW